MDAEALRDGSSRRRSNSQEETQRMTISQLLTIGAVACLGTAAVLARRHLRIDCGLRRALGALSFSALAAVALAFSPTPKDVWPLGLLMLGGVAFMVWCLHAEQRRKDRA